MAFCMRVLLKSQNNCRLLSTSNVLHRKNVRKFPLFHFRWTKDFKKRQEENPDPDIIVYDYGVRQPVFKLHGKKEEIPEMIPELVVPDLTDCKLAPYVSYKAPNVIQSEFTPRDLFDAVYSRKIEDDFRFGKLDENGVPLEPSDAEKLTKDEAKKLARKTGSDIFQ